MGILDEVKSQVGSMDADAVRNELLKLKAQAAERQAKQKERNTDPQNVEKRREYSKKYREQVMADPTKAEKVERRKAYMSKPEVKERQKAYRTKRNERIKALEARAKELGIDVQPATA
jgi:hypothetical protein